MRINTSLFAPMILQGPSLWGYSAWQQCANYIDRRIDITPREPNTITGANWTDQTLTFTPPKTADRAGETQFMGSVSAVTTTGGTTASVVDGFGYQVWQQSTVVNGQNTLQIIRSEDAYDEYASLYSPAERDAIAFGAKCDLADAVLKDCADVGFDFWVDMPYYWTTTLDRNLNLFAQAIEHTITIQLNPINKCYNHDRTTLTATLSKLRLRILYSHYSAKERDDYLTDVCTGMGLIWKLRDIQRTTIKVPSGSTGIIQYPLNSINGDVQTLVLMPRLTADIDGSVKAMKPYSNFQALPKVRITGNGNEEFYPWTEGNFILYHCHRKAGYPGPSGKRIYRINFERYPALGPNSYSGSRYFGNITQPQLEIDWNGTTTAAEITIYVKAIIVNYLQHQNGEVSRAIPTF